MQRSLAEQLALDPIARAAFVGSLSEDEKKLLEYEWDRFWSRPKQVAPPGDWRYWLILAGRGFGKTRCGAEWVCKRARSNPKARIALVAETAADARDVMVEGDSGIISVSPPWFMPRYEPSKRRVTWPNGARATTFTAEKPKQLRGPQHTDAWADEVAKWRYADAWDQLMMGLRLGENPRACITTTPRPIPLLKEMLRDSQLNPENASPLVHVTKGTTYENIGNLAPKFLAVILKKYEGTRLGRQELEAEMLDDAPGALWQRTQIDADRVTKVPELVRIVIAIDPSVSSDSDEAETGIIAAGLGTDGHGYILGDGSMIKPTPEQWAMSAITLFNTNHADRVIGEVNNGGDLVEANVKAVAKSLQPPQRIPFKQVRASRGKQVRAEPISSFYEQHRVHHVGAFPLLEDQLCQWEPGVSTWSPNRLDALVWALTELMFGPGHKDIDLSGGGGGRGWSRT